MNTTQNSGRKSARVMGLAITTALATATLAGCSAKVAPPASASAAMAQTAIAKGRGGAAVSYAESAVLASPRDAQLRALLGASYVEAGRFESAAATLFEAVQLGDTSGRTLTTLALAQIASGRQDDAIMTLDSYEDAIDPADFGLAIALAGQPQRGILVLGNQLRFGENSAKVRQNLAYAYALQGDWRAARIMAAEDVPADRVGERIGHWAQMTNPSMYRQRVADLLGVSMANDPGQPAMLALENHRSVDQLAAETLPAPAVPAPPAPRMALAANGELPAVGMSTPPATQAVQSAPSAAAVQAAPGAVPGARFLASEQVQNVPAKSAPAATGRQASTEVASVQPRPKLKPAAFEAQSGDYRVQLGSYFSMSDAQQAWKVFQSRHPELAGAQKVITKARVKGKMYYRVAAAGYAKSSAQSLCSLVKRGGGGCIAYAANNPLPGALDTGVRVAAR